jgi:hypothetical protein
MISSGLYVTCSIAITWGVPALIGIRDLMTMKPSTGGRPDGDVEPPREPGLPPMGLPPETLKPLPDCLIPKLGPVAPPVVVRQRELEPV